MRTMPSLLDRLRQWIENSSAGVDNAEKFYDSKKQSASVDFYVRALSTDEDTVKALISEFTDKLELRLETLGEESDSIIRLVASGGSARAMEDFQARLSSQFSNYFQGLSASSSLEEILDMTGSQTGRWAGALSEFVRRTLSHLDACLSQYQLDEVSFFLF